MISRHAAFTARRVRAAAPLLVALGVATCRDGNPAGLGLPGSASLSIAPQMERSVARGGPTFTSIRRARGTLTPVGGGATYATNADFIGDSATLSFAVTFAGPRQLYTLDIAAIDTAGDTLFRSLREVTAQPGVNSLVADTLRYVAPDTAVRFILLTLSDTVLLGGDSIRVSARGYGAQQQVVTPLRVGWTSRDTSSAAVSARSTSAASLVGGKIEHDVWVVARAFNGTADSILVPVHLKVASVLLAVDTVRLTLGDVGQLAATVVDPSGSPLANRTVTWSSFDQTIASVQPIALAPQGSTLATNFASVAALGVGATKIVASTAGKSDTSVVIVSPAPVASVRIVPDTIALLVGGQARLSAELRDARNNLLTNRVVAWSSADTLLARVDTAGVVTAVVPGLVAVRAVAEGIVATASVRIDNVPATVVRTVVSPATVTLNALGQAAQLAARSYQANSTLVAGTYTWRVSTPSAGLFTVDGLGRLTALAVGTGYVVVTEAGGTSDSAQVVVTQIPLKVVIDRSASLNALGATATFHAAVVDSLGSAIPGAALAWTLDTPGVGTLLVTGGDSAIVRADGNGATGVIASAGSVSGTTRFFVSQAPAKIVVTPSALTLGVDGRALVSAVTYDANGRQMTPRAGDLQWAVEGSGGVLEVTQGGEVHARTVGVGGIFATISGLRSNTASVDISDVNPLVLRFSSDTLTFTDSARVSVFLSAARTLPVTVTLADATKLVRFAVDTLIIQPGLARQDVMVYVVSRGTTTITATDIAKLFAPATLRLTIP